MFYMRGKYFTISDRTTQLTPIFLYYYCRCASSSSTINHKKDHYNTLGVSRNATAKEIKLAFYELSKKHHPDMNPDNKTQAAQKFQDISEAYEVLSSDEKKRIYDSLTTQREHAMQPQRFYRNTVEPTRGAKDWSDLDLDYKDFEHFQRLNRRRRVFHGSAGNTADKFWEAHHDYAENYKNNRVLQREMLERQLEAELQERKRKAAHPIPTFEQLIIQERARHEREEKRRNQIVTGALPFIVVVAFIYASKMV